MESMLLDCPDKPDNDKKAFCNSTIKRVSGRSFTPLEKATDFSRWLSPYKAAGGLKPPLAHTVRERSSLTGFTLIEFVMVLVIIGIIVALVLPRFDVFYAVKFRTAVKRVVQDIRYVQNVAMTQHVRTRMVFNPVGDTYKGEYYDTTSSLWVDLKDSFQNPLRMDYTTDIQYGGIDLSAANFGGSTPGILIFTFAGIPQNSDENDITTAGFVNLDYKDYPQEVINVTPKTGKVVLP